MTFKIITAVPAVPRFFWEAEVLLTNLKSVAPDVPVVLIFDDQNSSGVAKVREKYPHVEIHELSSADYVDVYAPARQLYLIHKYLAADPARELDTYMQIDTDIIFRQFPQIKAREGKWATGGDCSGYIDYQYLITRVNGERIVNGFAKILNVPVDLIKDAPGIGAQYVIAQPTANLYWHMWQDSIIMHHFLAAIDSDIQKFTAGMWSQLYNLAKFGYHVAIDHELDHCAPTDNVEMWKHRNILHNAGVIGEDAKGLFYRGKYIEDSPFGADLSWVRRDKASIKYVEAIQAVRR